jgi:hypothetical protein
MVNVAVSMLEMNAVQYAPSLRMVVPVQGPKASGSDGGSASDASAGLDPKAVDSDAMNRAYERMLLAKQDLSAAMQMVDSQASGRQAAAQMARQVAAAAQEYVSLGGNSSALLEPSLPVTNSGRIAPMVSEGYKAYVAAIAAIDYNDQSVEPSSDLPTFKSSGETPSKAPELIRLTPVDTASPASVAAVPHVVKSDVAAKVATPVTHEHAAMSLKV